MKVFLLPMEVKTLTQKNVETFTAGGRGSFRQLPPTEASATTFGGSCCLLPQEESTSFRYFLQFL